MKWFWLVITIVVIAGAAVLLSRPGSGSGGSRPPAPAADPLALPPLDPRPIAAGNRPSNPPQTTTPQTSELQSTTPSTGDSSKPTIEPRLPSSVDAPATPAQPRPDPEPETASSTSSTSKPATDAPVSEPQQPTEPNDVGETKAAIAAELDRVLSGETTLINAGKDQPPAVANGQPAQSSTAASAPAAPAADVPVRLSKQPDGSTLVDGTFSIRGSGQQADPFVIPWEILVSAQDTYQPRLGRKIIPERLKMLDGKWVRIDGYIAFPIIAQSQDEMLMMLNQWDGCCIGLPPTPYDAIEVKLSSAAEGDDRLRVSGSVTGILRVDPYLVKDWLVSLFIMDKGELKASGEKREGPVMPHDK
jgi:hypothetical protein